MHSTIVLGVTAYLSDTIMIPLPKPIPLLIIHLKEKYTLSLAKPKASTHPTNIKNIVLKYIRLYGHYSSRHQTFRYCYGNTL
ncbi:hypothetical protein XELAEV_18041492mg [Xenopus laevis]|uniref:Uncharacterized protein n=1 Tax=Xenopus laevis TaxID=8355 RepID=A0A974H544_XENLA|nr:hypothetical protein XELAEV_18041492mg [Xenopus laevis]